MSLEGDDFHSLGAKPAEDFARNRSKQISPTAWSAGTISVART